MISVKNLKKNFEKLEVLKGVSCEIEKGEKIAVIGPSGSGKSTFLRCLNLLEIPSGGEVWLDGKLVNDIDLSLHPEFEQDPGAKRAFLKANKIGENEARRKMGMVFQHFNLFNNLTIIKNITLAPVSAAKIERSISKKLNKLKAAFDKAEDAKKAALNEKASKLCGNDFNLAEYEIAPLLSNSEIKKATNEKAMALLTRIGLADKANVYPSTLSGGQKQRVAIIRALAMDPEVLLFDEPTSALDIEMVKEVLNLIKELADEGMTMIIVTHELKFARDVATRVIFMDDGQIIECDKPRNIFTKPKTDRLKEFLAKVSEK